MKYLVDFLRAALPQGLAKLRLNFVWTIMALIVGLVHTAAIMALLALKLIPETVALAVLDHSLSLTVLLCVIGALFPSKKSRGNKNKTPPNDEP